jgi:hypothetical protein
LVAGNCTHDGSTLDEADEELALKPGSVKFRDVFLHIAFKDMQAFTELKALEFERADFDIFHDCLATELARNNPKCDREWLHGHVDFRLRRDCEMHVLFCLDP